MISVISKVKSCIESCDTSDQILSCAEWALNLSRRNYLSFSEYKIISGYLYFKWREINGSVDHRFVE